MADTTNNRNTNHVEPGQIACPECKHAMVLDWKLLSLGQNPQCAQCGLVLIPNKTESSKSLRAAARLNKHFQKAENHYRNAQPQGLNNK